MMGLRAPSPKFEFWIPVRGGCTKFELGCTKLYEMCTELWHHFSFEIRKWWGYVPPASKFEFWIPGKGRVYKFVRNVCKIMTPFLFWNLKMVWLCASSPPNLNCEYQGRGGCTKFELGCTELYEMCTKLWHHFYFEIWKWWPGAWTSPKQFSTVFSENTFIRKHCRIKNIQHLICDKKDYIHFWCKMTRRLHSDHWRGSSQATVLLPFKISSMRFLRQKFF